MAHLQHPIAERGLRIADATMRLAAESVADEIRNPKSARNRIRRSAIRGSKVVGWDAGQSTDLAATFAFHTRKAAPG
jgi:hypothetical protein